MFITNDLSSLTHDMKCQGSVLDEEKQHESKGKTSYSGKGEYPVERSPRKAERRTS
jgi:hypothetical protein